MSRNFVLMGQGGRLTSMGMAALAERIPHSSLHAWNDPDVLPEINQTVGPLSVTGFSLGGCQLGWLSIHATRRIDLGIAYDPSWLSPLVKRLNGKYLQVALNFGRLICYRNTGAWVFGGSTYIGRNVEEHSVSNFHLAMQFDESLHRITLAAIGQLK